MTAAFFAQATRVAGQEGWHIAVHHKRTSVVKYGYRQFYSTAAHRGDQHRRPPFRVSFLIDCLREADPKGWSAVLVTALGIWGKPVVQLPSVAMLFLWLKQIGAYVKRQLFDAHHHQFTSSIQHVPHGNRFSDSESVGFLFPCSICRTFGGTFGVYSRNSMGGPTYQIPRIESKYPSESSEKC
jgi:hypothetical protein